MCILGRRSGRSGSFNTTSWANLSFHWWWMGVEGTGAHLLTYIDEYGRSSVFSSVEPIKNKGGGQADATTHRDKVWVVLLRAPGSFLPK
jgi:hypothetical protein